MHSKNPWPTKFTFILICGVFVGLSAGREPAFTQIKADSKSNETELITAEELKARVDRKETITIIDVRGNSGYILSDDKIKGAIHIKLRKLKSRLTFPPLKDIPRDRQIVTYCACPSDETSVRAAQLLRDAGFKRVRALKGGWQKWLRASGHVEPRPKGL